MAVCAHNGNCINANTEICHQCSHEPGWSYRSSYFQDYKPACPIGYSDCVIDPAYIKHNYPDWYKDLYGDMTVQEAVKKHCHPTDGWCDSYDDEDK